MGAAVERVNGIDFTVIGVTKSKGGSGFNNADDVIYIPASPEYTTPILSVVPLQLFAYHMAVILGKDVDKPRNLAKSVTVP